MEGRKDRKANGELDGNVDKKNDKGMEGLTDIVISDLWNFTQDI